MNANQDVIEELELLTDELKRTAAAARAFRYGYQSMHSIDVSRLFEDLETRLFTMANDADVIRERHHAQEQAGIATPKRDEP
jgi:hypothetical protein